MKKLNGFKVVSRSTLLSKGMVSDAVDAIVSR
jgi:hypothetical protein